MASLNQAWEELGTFAGHNSWIYGVPITSDCVRAASNSYSDVFLWNLKSRELDTVLKGHTDIVHTLCISPDDRILASGSSDKTIKLWDLDSLELVSTLIKRKDPIYSLSFSPDSKLLAAGGENKYKSDEGKRTSIYLWDVRTGELVSTLTGHKLRINSVAFSPDGKNIASGSNDLTVRVWDVETGTQLYFLKGHEEQVSSVAFTPDNKSLVSSGGGGIKLWNVETGELNLSFSNDGEYVRCFAVHPSGKFLAAGTTNGIDIWNLEKSEKLHSIVSEWPVSLAFSPNGELLSSGDTAAFSDLEDAGGAVRVWRVPQPSIEPPVINPFDISEKSDAYQQIEQEGLFDPNSIEDARKRTMASIVRRQGQSEFRRQLLSAYDGSCAITGCDAIEALEAAHIVPYQGVATNHLTNGILLRADIHTLFDLHLLSISPGSNTVELSSKLLKTSYKALDGKQLTLPNDEAVHPSQSALQKHYSTFLRQ